jgi:hypothetical protein
VIGRGHTQTSNVEFMWPIRNWLRTHLIYKFTPTPAATTTVVGDVAVGGSLIFKVTDESTFL